MQFFGALKKTLKRIRALCAPTILAIIIITITIRHSSPHPCTPHMQLAFAFPSDPYLFEVESDGVWNVAAGSKQDEIKDIIGCL